VEVPVPQPKPAEAVVKVAVAGVNSIDGYFRDGRYRARRFRSSLAGRCGSGCRNRRADQNGEGGRPCGVERSARFVRRVRGVRRRASCAVPAAISDEQAAASMVHGLTAHYLVNDAHKLKAGETALVHAAAGGVGLLLVQMAHAIDARVIGTASSEEKGATGARGRRG